jgi:SAM-dependent MidA family methyltransferase
MEWVLHDPEWGAYGSGRLEIGPTGDFATSPSLGGEFAALLAPQLAAWLEEIGQHTPGRLSLVEAGPGEGSLALDLANALKAIVPELASRLELVLVEPNAGMAARQRARLANAPLPVRWSSWETLAEAPVAGVLLAHEVLDALAVQRFERRSGRWCEQRVQLLNDQLVLVAGEELGATSLEALTRLGLGNPLEERPEGWCSELHPGVTPWLNQAAAALREGRLLVIDYAMEAWRYYAPHRSNGTLMAYRNQEASSNPLREPGEWDLTAHLCIDGLQEAARTSGWQPFGHRRQGEALLALGLAQRLHGLQRDQDLDTALQRRETLLRLVDPGALGDFRWLAFRRTPTSDVDAFTDGAAGPTDLFLLDPALGETKDGPDSMASPPRREHNAAD